MQGIGQIETASASLQQVQGEIDIKRLNLSQDRDSEQAPLAGLKQGIVQKENNPQQFLYGRFNPAQQEIEHAGPRLIISQINNNQIPSTLHVRPQQLQTKLSHFTSSRPQLKRSNSKILQIDIKNVLIALQIQSKIDPGAIY